MLALTLSTSHQPSVCDIRVNGGVNGGECTEEFLRFTRSMKEMSLTSLDNSQRAGKEQAIFDVPITELFLHCIKLSASLDYTSREVQINMDSNCLRGALLVPSPRFVLKGVLLVPG